MTKEMELMIQNQMITNNLLTILVTKTLINTSGGHVASNTKLANLLDECVDDAVAAGLVFKDLTSADNKR